MTASGPKVAVPRPSRVGNCRERARNCGRMLLMLDSPHWTSNTPVDPGWYWYRAPSHRATMLRIDECSVIDSTGEFADFQAINLDGDWWSAPIKVFV